MLINMLYSPRCVHWRMPLSKGAHQNHWNKVILLEWTPCKLGVKSILAANNIFNILIVLISLLWFILEKIRLYHFIIIIFLWK